MTITVHCRRPPRPDLDLDPRSYFPPRQVWWESDDLPIGVLLTENRMLLQFDTLTMPVTIEGGAGNVLLTATIDPEDRP